MYHQKTREESFLINSQHVARAPSTSKDMMHSSHASPEYSTWHSSMEDTPKVPLPLSAGPCQHLSCTCTLFPHHSCTFLDSTTWGKSLQQPAADCESWPAPCISLHGRSSSSCPSAHSASMYQPVLGGAHSAQDSNVCSQTQASGLEQHSVTSLGGQLAPRALSWPVAPRC